jgi:hypothetical protein
MDVQDWCKRGSLTTTAINNCYVIQRYNVEIYRAISNFSIKEGQVMVQNDLSLIYLESKYNKPSLSVTNALVKAYALLGYRLSSLHYYRNH